ncbi:RNA polymerase II B8 subunit [Cryptosporidium ryanae]|uniref:RNA polymerase II B8 subunit n=1 Tax=Cryptosporidium ryanae TaxID=515981 RepID=UPI00351A564B|nr:RNA polymerase II B8 subunit [Cryptosporidium ryanae]
MALPSCLFEDRFVINSVDNGKFERVGRVRGKSVGFDADLIMDINNELFPVREKESLYIGLSSQVSSNNECIIWDNSGPQTLMDQYDYVMYGKIYRIEEKQSDRRSLYASFGGLLMSITADRNLVGDFSLDMRIYCLVRRSEDII